MSNIFYASKELLQTYNQYNRDNFNHGYSEKEFEDLDDSVMYPVSKVDKSKATERYFSAGVRKHADILTDLQNLKF